MTDTLGVHVLHTLQDLVDNSGDLNLSDVLLRSDHIQKLSTSGQLGNQSHLVLGVVHLDQTDQTRMVKNIHHLELVHHPGLVASTVHHLGGKVASSESVGDHGVILSGSLALLDIPVQPPVLGLGLLDGVVTGLLRLDGDDLLDEVGDTLGAPADLLAGVVELVKSLGAGDDLLGPPVGHPLELLLVLQDADHHRVGDGAAQVGGGDSVEPLVLGDVVLEEESVGLGRIVMGLHSGGLLQRLEILEPDNLRLGNTKDLTFDLATIDTDQVDVKRSLDELWVLSHHDEDWLHHVAVVVDSVALVGTNIRGTEAVDAELDHAVPGVVDGVLVTVNVQVLALKLEGDGWHGEAVEVPCDVWAGVLDGVLSDLLLLEEVRAVGVALVRLLVDVESLREPGGGCQVEWLARLQEQIPGTEVSTEDRPVGHTVGGRVAETEAVTDGHSEFVVTERDQAVDVAADAADLIVDLLPVAVGILSHLHHVVGGEVGAKG